MVLFAMMLPFKIPESSDLTNFICLCDKRLLSFCKNSFYPWKSKCDRNLTQKVCLNFNPAKRHDALTSNDCFTHLPDGHLHQAAFDQCHNRAVMIPQASQAAGGGDDGEEFLEQSIWQRTFIIYLLVIRFCKVKIIGAIALSEKNPKYVGKMKKKQYCKIMTLMHYLMWILTSVIYNLDYHKMNIYYVIRI